MKAIISAGGRGTRMRPLTFSSNKHLIPLANKPLIFYAIETVVEAGIKEIGINYNPGQLKELVAALGNGRRWGVKFTYILQSEPKGLANIIQVSQDFVGKEKFFLYLGDNIFYGGIKALVNRFAGSKADGLVTILHHKENYRLGVPYFDKKGNLIKYVEKPLRPPHDWAIPGLYFFNHRVFDCFRGKEAIQPSARGELEISSPYQWLLDHGYQIETEEFKGVWKDPGKFDDWLETNTFILDKKLGDKVRQGSGVKLKNTILIGPVMIGKGTTIESSRIGPHVSIGDNCQLKKVKMEETILCNNVVIDDPSRGLRKCLIGDGTNIGKNNKGEMELFLSNQCYLKI